VFHAANARHTRGPPGSQRNRLAKERASGGLDHRQRSGPIACGAVIHGVVGISGPLYIDKLGGRNRFRDIEQHRGGKIFAHRDQLDSRPAPPSSGNEGPIALRAPR